MSEPQQPDRGEIVASLVLGVMFLVPLLIWGPIDDEEVALGVFASQVHYHALLHGQWLFWLNNLGFGTPLPIGQRLDFHPLFALAGFTTLRVALSMVWLAHVAVMVVYFLRLAAVSGIGRRLRVLLLGCYLFSAATVCLLYVTDWISMIIVWTLFPAIVYYVRQALAGEAVTHFWLAALRLGLLLAFWILNGHPAYIATLGTVLAVYVLVASPMRLRPYACLLVAVLLAAAASAERLFFLSSELRGFPPEMMRSMQAGYSLMGYLEAAAMPFVSYGRDMRLPFIGVIFGLAAIAAVARSWRERDRHVRALAIAFAAAVAISLINKNDLAPLKVFAAVWLFRDPMVFFGLLAAGTVLQRGLDSPRPQWRKAVGVLVAVQVLQQAATVQAGFREYYSQHPFMEFYRHQGRGDGFAGVIATRAREYGPRLYLSQTAQEIARRNLSSQGLHVVTDLTFLDVAPVTAWFKSVSMDRLYPSPELMHGYIRGQQAVIENGPLLDVLGINLILTTRDEGPLPEGLTLLDRQPMPRLPRQPELQLAANPGAWPRAVLLSSEARLVPLPLRQGCPNAAALCRDYSPLIPTRLPAAVDLSESNGRYHARFAPADRERLLFLSVLYRDEWEARSERGPLAIAPLANAFLGVTVPAGTGEVDLAFMPRTRMALAWFSGGALGALLVAFAVAAIKARRRA